MAAHLGRAATPEAGRELALTWRLDHVQIAIPEGGEALARGFWVALLGMEELAKPEALAGRGGLWLRAGEAELHLGVEAPFAPAKKAHPCFAVPDLGRLAAALEAAGRPVRPDDSIQGRRRIFTEDPFGNRVELMEG
ncbi:VOC family protein [Pseudoroseicyclus sp. CXY001]|uniref:VOC family protein n=1 Tax=Pseudoroseicyclus sp. CXY001 TaxID=3242492 RepID=UPI003570AEFB